MTVEEELAQITNEEPGDERFVWEPKDVEVVDVGEEEEQ